MKNSLSFIYAFGLFFCGCQNLQPFHEVKLANPVYYDNTAFLNNEDLASPRYKEFKSKFQLDTVFRGERDEFKRILLLRNWISQVVKISDFEAEYPGDGYADKILDAALKGQGYHCGHYMIVQNAVMNTYGYIARCLGAGPGVKGGPDWHHGINEIWSNQFQKWFLSDAKYNHHFEKNDIPLSALEVRDEYLKNRAADIVLKKGPDRTTIEYDSVKNAAGKFIRWYKKDFAQAYTWIEWEKFNNRFTDWPANSDELSRLNMYTDDYFTNNKWIWDGKPHWAYNTPHMILVKDRKAIEWTPNTIMPKLTILENKAHIDLTSSTPNLKSYQMKSLPSGDWKDVPATMEVVLEKNRNEMIFRAVNLAGVTGPESKVIIER